nr:alcohol dehydrogenase catalytic domain-containing protein [Segniliparus rotundus]
MEEPVAKTMQAVVCHGPQDYRVEEMPVPVPGPGEALIRVEAVGICGSDLKCFQGAAKFWGDEGRAPWAHTGVIPGHEFVGRVVRIDEDASLRWGVKLGDRVSAEQIVPCWECRFCRKGNYHMCVPHDIYGFRRGYNGAMATYMLFPAKSLVHKISGELAPEHAAFCEPLACSLHAVQRAHIRFDDVVVVAGCGPIGLGMIAGAKARNPQHIVALDMKPEKLELAARCGADTTVDISQNDPNGVVLELTEGLGADVYLEGTGHASAVPQGLKLLRKQGKYIEYGVFRDAVAVDWTIISDDKELDVLGAHLGPNCWPTAIRMLESQSLPLDDICTHQFPLTDFEKGFELVGDGSRSVKVSLIPS